MPAEVQSDLLTEVQTLRTAVKDLSNIVENLIEVRQWRTHQIAFQQQHVARTMTTTDEDDRLGRLGAHRQLGWYFWNIEKAKRTLALTEQRFASVKNGNAAIDVPEQFKNDVAAYARSLADEVQSKRQALADLEEQHSQLPLVIAARQKQESDERRRVDAEQYSREWMNKQQHDIEAAGREIESLAT